MHGGDRLPWVETEPGKGNFAPLTSLVWQVHIYGELRHGIADVCEKLQLPLHVFPWQPAMKRAGLKNGSLYLIRPDGYVALADPESIPNGYIVIVMNVAFGMAAEFRGMLICIVDSKLSCPVFVAQDLSGVSS